MSRRRRRKRWLRGVRFMMGPGAGPGGSGGGGTGMTPWLWLHF